MSHRTGNLIALTGIPAAAAVLSMLMITAGAGWPQAAAPPSLGIQTPAQQAAPEPPALP